MTKFGATSLPPQSAPAGRQSRRARGARGCQSWPRKGKAKGANQQHWVCRGSLRHLGADETVSYGAFRTNRGMWAGSGSDQASWTRGSGIRRHAATYVPLALGPLEAAKQPSMLLVLGGRQRLAAIGGLGGRQHLASHLIRGAAPRLHRLFFCLAAGKRLYLLLCAGGTVDCLAH